jgi:ribosome-associated toxin RatA of RatAB toxin-antitoxin module
MKQLHGSAAAVVPAGEQECMGLLADVGGYPSWHPEVVRRVEVLSRDERGRARQVRTTLHLSRGPLQRDFELVMAVHSERAAVRLARIAHDRSDVESFEVSWRVAPAGRAGSKLELSLGAVLEVPRLLPLGGIGDALAGGFVTAAARALGAQAR